MLSILEQILYKHDSKVLILEEIFSDHSKIQVEITNLKKKKKKTNNWKLSNTIVLFWIPPKADLEMTA